MRACGQRPIGRAGAAGRSPFSQNESPLRTDDLFDPFLAQPDTGEAVGIAMGDYPELPGDQHVGQDTLKRRVTVPDETGQNADTGTAR